MIGGRPAYAAAAGLIFAVELFIALRVHDTVVRPYVGDSLAVLLVYLELRAVTPLRVLPAAIVAFGVASLIEFGQLIGILGILGLERNVLARTILGTGFDPADFIAYAAGALAAVGVEAVRPGGGISRTAAPPRGAGDR
jgi:hypothetical protein